MHLVIIATSGGGVRHKQLAIRHRLVGASVLLGRTAGQAVLALPQQATDICGNTANRDHGTQGCTRCRGRSRRARLCRESEHEDCGQRAIHAWDARSTLRFRFFSA